ncbi:TVP38/TMEM64 family protein [Coraliomargarita akajimensis]|uniref:SNARE associated Golgi protein-related protein n=1 Tax=Coraliomargarita akajimensis (strain DSM 45221 / IAM 15411 / JCM 23193 / KCTC 12865 / 04OKA010-24) TaxID=583355 RepID=D5EHT5_CORAD|nr:VTT domain-containing protein [Coraliomargarita akajimensis]ADE54126.1 SNARE associated Golgi protein-related protein [Coraliomargarita akajimensis DSM 45221]
MPDAQPDLKKRNLRNLILFLLPGIASASIVYALWQAHPDIEYWRQLVIRVIDFLKAHPWALVLSVVILPGIGAPISPLLVLFGIVLSPLYGVPAACLIGIAANTACCIWTYFLANGPLRDFLKRSVLRDRTLPELTPGNAMRIGFIIRITPGIPFALQNVVLGVLDIPFRTYLLVSIPPQAMYTCGFIITGGAIFEGNLGLAITGVLLLIVVILATRMLRKRSSQHAG